MAEPRYVPVIAPDGSKMELPEANLSAALQDGFAVDESAEYEGQGGRTLLEGVGRGLSLGLSDAVQTGGAGIGTDIGNYLADLTGVGPTERAVGAGMDAGVESIDRSGESAQAMVEAKQGIAGRQEANAGEAVAGELGGGVLLGLMTGGLGTAGLAARGTSALGRAGYMGLAGAIEGAAYSAAKAADDDFLADQEITAERILMGAGEGAILGGALSGGVSLLGSGAKWVAGRTKEMVGNLGERLGMAQKADELTGSLETAMRVESDEALSAGADALAESSLALSTDDALKTTAKTDAEAGLTFELSPSAAIDPIAEQEARGVLRSSGLKDDGRSLFQQARAAEGGFEKTQQAATTKMSTDLKDFIKSSDKIDEYAGISAKRRVAEHFNMPGMKIGMQEVGPVLENARAGIQYLMSNEVRKEALKSGGGYTVVSRVTDMLDSVEREVSKAFASGDIGDGYMMLDQGLKKVMQQAAKSRNPLVAEVFEKESAKVLDFLQDETIWGELATKQRMVNPAWTEAIRKESDADIAGFFKRGSDAAENPFEVLDRPNDRAIGSLLNELGSAESAGTEEAFRRFLRAKVIDAETRAAAWGGPELKRQAASMRAAAENIEKQMNDVALMRRDATKWAEVRRTADSVPFLGAALKGAVKLTQSAANMAESSMSRRLLADTAARGSSIAEVNAARRASVITSAKHAAARGEQQVENSAANLVRSVVRGVGNASAAASRKAASSIKAVPIAGVILNPRDPASYEQTIHRLRLLQDSASEERRQLEERDGVLAMEAPDHAKAISSQIQRTADFLLDKAGVTPADMSTPFAHLRKPKHDRAKAESLARYARAAQNPQAALKRVSDGSASREDAETVKELYPRLWARFGAKVRAQLIELKEPPSYAEQLRLSRLLEQPMTPFETPAFQAAIVATNGMAAEAEQRAQNQSFTKLANATTGSAAGSDQALSRGQ